MFALVKGRACIEAGMFANIECLTVEMFESKGEALRAAAKVFAQEGWEEDGLWPERGEDSLYDRYVDMMQAGEWGDALDCALERCNEESSHVWWCEVKRMP